MRKNGLKALFYALSTPLHPECMKPVLFSILFFSSLGWAIAQENSTHQTVAALREAVQALRVEAEATFQREEAACHQRYQVFRCINEAQEKRFKTELMQPRLF